MIYLGTGFCPSGWNTEHGSFDFNPTVFPDPATMIKEMHQEHFKVIVHVVSPPEDLHGSVKDTGAAAEDPSNAANYWLKHRGVHNLGVDAWWPDEGDELLPPSRLARNQMYWEGSQLFQPNVRPFSLHRNGYAGMQRYVWLWSGDTLSTWKTLQAQIMVGITTGLSGIPYWGTDTGGFVPTKELTAELFVRWFQFSAHSVHLSAAMVVLGNFAFHGAGILATTDQPSSMVNLLQPRSPPRKSCTTLRSKASAKNI